MSDLQKVFEIVDLVQLAIDQTALYWLLGHYEEATQLS